ncbi:chloride channel protein [Streptomyces sp. H34-S4]|uniref:chloride channel protein n=1 Tax=Streptomyces sp. H34-S4 TaxID=2996463 RepID=UPI002271968F|nr:chloride channel protein [Streptomyces sp. H34-S4]MCY0938465.1 chloride channel protein [Streptomyces sp. H34-S4]
MEQAQQPASLRQLLTAPGTLRLLALSALIGIPVSLFAFGFVSLEHELQHWVWRTAPDLLGYARPPWWWGLPTLALAGLLAAPIITRMPGAGGHVPAHGFGGPPTMPRETPSVVLAALACLPLGVMLGPEAPLMAMGSGLALLSVRAAKRATQPELVTVLGMAGSTAAISTIFGSPLIPVVMVLEGAALVAGGPRLFVLILPALIASGVGALVFTGFGHWTGLEIGALTLPQEPAAGLPDAGDFLWGVPMAALIGVVVALGKSAGLRVHTWTGTSAKRIVLCALAVAVCVTGYALVTGRSPDEVALSGQNTVGMLAAEPSSWAVGALVALAVFKLIGWSIALGSLRGGPIFPSIMIGATIGVACGSLPGFGMGPALAAGICAAGVAGTRLPVTGVVLAAALLGKEAPTLMPLLVISAVTALLASALIDRQRPADPAHLQPASATDA